MLLKPVLVSNVEERIEAFAAVPSPGSLAASRLAANTSGTANESSISKMTEIVRYLT